VCGIRLPHNIGLAIRFSALKTKPRFEECNTGFGCETKTGVSCILVIFQDRPMFSHIIQKVSARAFHWCGWTYVYVVKLPRYALPPFKFIPKTGIAFPKTGGFVSAVSALASFCFVRLGAKRKRRGGKYALWTEDLSISLRANCRLLKKHRKKDPVHSADCRVARPADSVITCGLRHRWLLLARPGPTMCGPDQPGAAGEAKVFHFPG